MSIFEPIAEVRVGQRESAHDAVRDSEPEPDDAARGRSFDPRSIKIAGLVTAALVILGLLVSNAAKPDPEPRRSPISRVEPGAAAVELVEPGAETVQQTESANAGVESGEVPVEAIELDDDQIEGQSLSTDDGTWDGDSKRDRPGKGNGRGHGNGR